jgi:hypothetical protein
VGKAKSMAWRDEGVCGDSVSISAWVVGSVITGMGALNGVMAVDGVEVGGEDLWRSCKVLESAD